MVPLVSDVNEDPSLAKILSQFAYGIVFRTKLVTAEAFQDFDGAEEIRRILE